MTERVDVNESTTWTEETSTGITIDGALLRKLPINGRDYARFSLLTPGALPRSNQIADLSFHGLQTVHNQFVMDGVDASRVDVGYMANGNERGARLLTGSLETIEEFRVQTANYEAQFGRASGAFISIATRAGSNIFHGTAFHLLRNSALDTRDFFNTKPETKAPFRFNNFGASLSGPLRKTSTFFTLNYEAARQRIGATATGTVPSAALRRAVLSTSPELAPILRIMPEGSAPTSQPLVDGYGAVRSLAVREDTGSARFDRYFRRGGRAYLRWSVNDSEVLGPLFTVSSGSFGLLDRQYVPIRTSNGAANYQFVATSSLMGELTAGVQRWDSFTDANGSGVPLTLITGLTIRAGDRGSGRSNHTSYQLGGSVTVSNGAHIAKFGGNVWNVRLVRQVSPTSILTFVSLEDLIANRVASATIGAGDPGSAVHVWQAAMYAQDSWRPAPRLTVDYGVRYDWSKPPYDPSRRTRPFDLQSRGLAPAGSAYFSANLLNVSPRLGVAWRPASRLILRSGYGIFFQSFPPGLAVRGRG